MNVFKGDNFSVIYYEMLKYGFHSLNSYKESRVGEVKDLGPVYFEIKSDKFRFPYLNKRAINPFFALAEFSWLITGSNQVKPLQFFIKGYDKYSDDGETLNGAYGHRLRYKFDVDQLEKAIEGLRNKPESRRIVLTMWSVEDLLADSNDLPCNISIMLKVRNEKLDITIINRSNDLFLGVPYNVYVFYLLQIYISEKIGCGLGVQRHFTDSLHIYRRDMDRIGEIIQSNSKRSIIATSEQFPLFDSASYVEVDHKKIIDQDYDGISNEDIINFFKSYIEYKKTSDFDRAIELLPKNQLGYVAYLWYREKRDYDVSNSFFDEVRQGIGYMKNDFEKIYTIKYESEDSIKEFILNISKEHHHLYECFLEIINTKSDFYSIKEENIDKGRLVQAVFLSIVMSSVASTIAPDINRLFSVRIENVAKSLGLEVKDIIHFTQFETKFTTLINS
ncbi:MULTISPECIES: thymidylate synthase [Pontibacillus]|uniref:thymidylate synthase n=1 Tax=Pontibacillus chungwhensis TaxID=265426 RepID=A0ABY8UYQ9_9BACI|nr:MULTISPECIES: thymidylate synthase [Pontibacillus]MCD5325951.1 thymidylate synthase [Pontibacillus sp. HN14]WIF98408.1 thymidylate synthase [Pontibacillus chungwhensis]